MSNDHPSAEWIEELIDAISQSSLPDAKKMVYLYALADGSFSENHFEQLSQDLAAISADLEESIAREEQTLQELEYELQQVTSEMDQASAEEAQAYEQGLESFVEEVSKDVSAEKQDQIKQSL